MSFHPAWTSHSNSSSRLPHRADPPRLLAFHSLANETSASAFSYFQQPTPLLKFTVVYWTALYTERFSVTETCADYLVQPTFCWALDDNQVAQDDHSYLSVSELHIQTPSFRLPHWADPLQTHRRQLVKSSSPLFRRSALHSRIILRKLIQEQHREGWSPL